MIKIDNFIALDTNKNVQFDIKTKDHQKLKKTTDQFEALLIKKVLDISIKQNISIFGKKDASLKIYNSMYNDAISKALGGNFGFSQILFDYLIQNSNNSKKI